MGYDHPLMWYFLSICLSVTGVGLISAGLRNPHARENIVFGILVLCAAALYVYKGRRKKREEAGGTGIDDNDSNHNGGQRHE